MAPKKKHTLLKVAVGDELKEGQTKKFAIKRKDRETEAFLLKKDGQYFAYLNLCRHWSVGLDFDDNEFLSEDGEWIVCKNHGAIYDPATGVCQSGPCGGVGLYQVPLVENNGILFADLEKVDWGES